jgi:hypothetical protein
MKVSEKPDCVIVPCFGICSNITTIDPNKKLAVISQKIGLPIIGQKEVSDYLDNAFASITNPAGYIDTWDVLTEAKEIMRQNNWHTAILVAHASHISRVIKQAHKLGINFAVAEGLPETWDSNSKQWWTRSRTLWVVREAMAKPYLKLISRL